MKNLGIFRFQPVKPQGNYAQSHQFKGQEYHNRFNEWPGRALMQELERNFLVDTLGKKNIHKYLDFACGTGRILDIASGYSASSFAVDVSQSMLDVAKSKHSNCNFICQDFRKGIAELDNEKFDLITAFRFFPNAEASLRLSALNYLAQRLSDDGLIIINNHQNFWSIPYIFFRFLAVRSGQRGMTDSDVKELAQAASLRIVNRVSFGLIPQTERISIFGWPLTRIFERFNAKHMSKAHFLGYNVLYVLTHA